MPLLLRQWCLCLWSTSGARTSGAGGRLGVRARRLHLRGRAVGQSSEIPEDHHVAGHSHCSLGALGRGTGVLTARSCGRLAARSCVRTCMRACVRACVCVDVRLCFFCHFARLHFHINNATGNHQTVPYTDIISKMSPSVTYYRAAEPWSPILPYLAFGMTFGKAFG